MWKFITRQFDRWSLRFRWKIWGITLKKLKFDRDTPPPHVDAPLRKILMHKIESDNNPWWLVPVSFLYDNLYWNKKECFIFLVFFKPTNFDFSKYFLNCIKLINRLNSNDYDKFKDCISFVSYSSFQTVFSAISK